MIEPAALASAATLLEPLLPAQRRAALLDAVARVEQWHARVLVLGEAKRGKSTLVNALFGAPLLPTGALPLTSVTTVVAERTDRGRGFYRSGGCRPARPAGAGLPAVRAGRPPPK